ncbi:MAG: hypothetical protein ACJ76H_01355 [Bacteriovoracaceae bacterium]
MPLAVKEFVQDGAKIIIAIAGARTFTSIKFPYLLELRIISKKSTRNFLKIREAEFVFFLDHLEKEIKLS